MLQSLRISNFALIAESQLHLNEGYTVITGETGSGKSILLNALNLILGERADFSVIGPDSNKSIVEAVFKAKTDFQAFFKENDLDWDNEIVIRREINKDGKSRAFINDTPVSLQVLKSLASGMVQIHSQYNTLELRSESYQLELLDVLSDLQVQRSTYKKAFQRFQEKNRLLKQKEMELQEKIKSRDYNQFVSEELAQLQLEKTDYESLEKQLLRLDQAESVRQLMEGIASLIEEGNFFATLVSLRQQLEKLAANDAELEEFKQRIQGLTIEIKELSNDASRFVDDFADGNVDKFALTEKLDNYNRLLNKHRFHSQEQLVELWKSLQGEEDSFSQLEQEIESLQLDIQKLETDLLNQANEMHEKRQASIIPITENLQAILAELKLPHTRLVIELEKVDQLNATGFTAVKFLFSANLGVSPVPIEKAASGGELSRLMLALQQMVSEKRALPTILFDEIDTGVSGDVAQKMGALLQKMGKTVQLIAISHLPQVAAKASQHLKVLKTIDGNRVNSAVIPLDNSERVEEIARLMSGEKINDAALENARVLMQN